MASRKKQAIKQRNFYLELAYLLADKPESCLKLKKKVWAEWDQIIQTSSMVEYINSILRPYLNHSNNQMTQKFLNTFMFYHNHRHYRSGKRKAKTPMELLAGKPQAKDWIERLFEAIKEPNLPA